MKAHPGTLFVGIVYLAVGVAFVLEALDVWDLRFGDLRYLGPLALVVVGVAVIVGALARRDSG